MAALGLGLAWAGLESFAVHLTQLGDARWEVTRRLAKLPRGSRVETYGLTVYQPHYDVSAGSPYRVTRVGPDRPEARNPLVGATELEGPIGDALERRPDVIVLPGGFANAYLPRSERPGAPPSVVVQKRRADRATAALVGQAIADQLPGYHQVLVAQATLPSWAAALGLEPVKIQSTTGSSVWVLERNPVPPTAEPAPIPVPATTSLR